MKLITTLTFALTLFCTVSMIAQTESQPDRETIDMTQSTAKGSAVIGAFGEIVQLPQEKTESTVSKNVYKKPTYFSDYFTGYSIQLTTSMERLADDDKLFSEFGDLMIEEATNPKFCYMMGEFRTKEGAQKFLETVILVRYPDAKVIRYKKGNRKRFK